MGPTSQQDVPFVSDESKPMKHIKKLASTSMKRMKQEMMGKIAN